MQQDRRWSAQAAVGVVLLVLGLAGAAALLALTIPSTAPLHPDRSVGGAGQVSGAAMGERIFRTGTDENGRPIPRSRGMGMTRSGLACASCHGADARGRTIQMMGQIEAPDIRWSTLSAPPTSPGDEAFDPDSFFQAVTRGIEPTGETLKAFMPRWELTRAGSDALIEYLKTR